MNIQLQLVFHLNCDFRKVSHKISLYAIRIYLGYAFAYLHVAFFYYYLANFFENDTAEQMPLMAFIKAYELNFTK